MSIEFPPLPELLSEEEQQQRLEALRYQALPVLDDGHVMLVDVMGSDQAIVDAARISFGKGTRRKLQDSQLVRMLFRHRHTGPFEQAELKFRIRMPMDAHRQQIRHRTANVNEYSTRYSEAIDEKQKTLPDQWRRQSTDNKQGSGDYLGEEWPEGFHYDEGVHYTSPDGSEKWSLRTAADVSTPGKLLSYEEEQLHQQAAAVYHRRLKLGVAREQARKDLPLSTYTEYYWKMDLHNLLHYLGLRMDAHAQLEIRSYAQAIGKIVAQLFPVTWQAFLDYRMEAVTLSALDTHAMRQLLLAYPGEQWPLPVSALVQLLPDEWRSSKHREAKEMIAKFIRLGLLTDSYS